MGAAAALGAPVGGVELDSLISQVKDLLPDLGEGFILACLEHYSYDPEQVINNILEERLAPALSQLDRSLDRWEEAHGVQPAQAPAGGTLGALSGALLSSSASHSSFRHVSGLSCSLPHRSVSQPCKLMSSLGKQKP